MASKLNNIQRNSKPYCSLISNRSTLPTYMQYFTNNLLSSLTLLQGNIAKIIPNLHSSKAHGHDDIILCICGPTIFKRLVIIFKQYVDTGVFPSEWKKGNIVKKGDEH